MSDVRTLEPWEMIREEWNREFARLDPQFVGWDGGGKQSNRGNVVARIEHKQRLKMGLPDKWDADGIQRPARHHDVIRHALSLGLSVPARVLAEYPDMAGEGAPS